MIVQGYKPLAVSSGGQLVPPMEILHQIAMGFPLWPVKDDALTQHEEVIDDGSQDQGSSISKMGKDDFVRMQLLRKS